MNTSGAIGFSQGGSGKTGLSSAGASIMGQQNSQQMRLQQQPFSFIAALDQLEDEIKQLREEVMFQRKEVRQLKGEQDTVEDVAKAQCADIERYLQKEIAILDDVQTKADKKQKTENQRFQLQISQVRQISSDLDASRVVCVKVVERVEQNLGIEFDPNQNF